MMPRRAISGALFGALASMLAVGCRGAAEADQFIPTVPTPAARVAGGEMSVQVGVKYGVTAPRFGELADVKVVVGNGHIQPILVRGVEFRGQVPELFSWITSLRGTLRERGRRIVWSRIGQVETGEHFARGFLYPGEILEFERPLRVREPSVEIIVRYQEVPMNEIGRNLLLPDLRRGAIDDRRVEFSAPSLSAVSAFRRLPPGDPSRLVLIRSASDWPMRVRRTDYSLTWADTDMPGAVLRELGVDGAELSRSESLTSWVVKRPGDPSIYLYADGDSEAVRVPGVGFDLFDLADTADRWNVPVDLVLTNGDVIDFEPAGFFEHLTDPDNPVLVARVDVDAPGGEGRRLVAVLEGGALEDEKAEESPGGDRAPDADATDEPTAETPEKDPEQLRDPERDERSDESPEEPVTEEQPAETRKPGKPGKFIIRR